MPALPTVGGDTNVWGTELNDFLLVAHNADGSLILPSSPAFTGTVTAAILALTGQAGASQSTRIAGATSAGAPATGTFQVGDVVIDRTGVLWICTAAGTPGTWKAVQNKASQQTVITSGSGTYTTPSRAIALIVECLGPGGTGGSCQTGTSSSPVVGLGGGGGGGGYAKSLITSPAASYPYVVGAGYGSNTTFGSSLVQGNYGGGGDSSIPSSLTNAPTSRAGGLGGSAIGDIVSPGSNGELGLAASTSHKWGGAGGRGGGPYGGPGALAAYYGGTGSGNGHDAAQGYGGGGGGAACIWGSGATIYQGGNGRPGLVVVTALF